VAGVSVNYRYICLVHCAVTLRDVEVDLVYEEAALNIMISYFR
jgi:hypothetical protein